MECESLNISILVDTSFLRLSSKLFLFIPDFDTRPVKINLGGSYTYNSDIMKLQVSRFPSQINH